MKISTLFVAFTLICFAPSPRVHAACQDACLANYSTAHGDHALINNTGIANTATGYDALRANTSGDGNTANGRGALRSNTTGSYNTASGDDALRSNTTGHNNTAIGVSAL